MLRCSTCGKSSGTLSNYYRHLRSVHDVTNPQRPPKKVQDTPHALKFENVEKFKDWKREVEQEDKSFFVISSTKTLKDSKKSYYFCNRSGTPRASRVPKDQRKRHFKLQGSSKIGTPCSARFTAVFTSEGVVFVKNLNRAHCGHESEPMHLPIPSPIKGRIAEDIATKIPFENILDRTKREFLPNEDVSRTHLINKQDLRNIAAQMHTEDAGSVEAWVSSEQANADECCIMMYKPLGEEPYGLRKSDFILGKTISGENDIVGCTEGSPALSYSLEETQGFLHLGVEEPLPQDSIQESAIIMSSRRCLNEEDSSEYSNTFVEKKKNDLTAHFQSIMKKCSSKKQVLLVATALRRLDFMLEDERKKRRNLPFKGKLDSREKLDSQKRFKATNKPKRSTKSKLSPPSRRELSSVTAEETIVSSSLPPDSYLEIDMTGVDYEVIVNT